MRTLIEMFRDGLGRGGDRPALRSKVNGEWNARTFRDWHNTALSLAAALCDLGVSPGDRVAILSNTRREWAEIDLAVMFAGAVSVPIYPQALPDGVEHILHNAGAVVLFAEDPQQVEKLFDGRRGVVLRALRRVVCLDQHKRLERPDSRGRLEVRLEDVVPAEHRSRIARYADVLTAGRRSLERSADGVDARMAAITTDSLATIVYTSGTTGVPRGVELTHGALATEVVQVVDRVGLRDQDEQLLFLPLAHIFGRMLLLGALRGLYCTAFAESPSRAVENFGEVHPTFFGAVPSVFESLRGSVERRIAQEGAVRKRTAEWAFGVALEVAQKRRENKPIGRALGAQLRLAQTAVLEQVRRLFGRRLKFAISGAAPLTREMAEWFHACDVLVLEGYGLTETTAATHINLPQSFRLGTVGRSLPDVETRVADDGEILVRGPTVMRGYHNAPDDTAQAIDEDGWLRTGDLGSVDAAGFLKITGRKKEMLITSAGRNIAPAAIEASLCRSPWIAQAVVVADARPHVVALVALREDTVRQWARGEGRDLPWQELLQHPAVLREVQQAVDALNRELEWHQRVRKFTVLERELSIQEGELTPTLKVRRAEVYRRHASTIDAMYAER